MDITICLILFFALLVFLVLFGSKSTAGTKKLPYQKKYLLTKNEYSYYQQIRPFAERWNFRILAKVRLADLVEVQPMDDKKQWYSYFGKIKSKHIDFVITDENMQVQFLIELDDSSHQQEDRIERDQFVDAVMQSVGYTLFHVHNHNEEDLRMIREQIMKCRGDME